MKRIRTGLGALAVAALVAGLATASAGAAGAKTGRIAYLIGGLGNTYLTAQVDAAKAAAKERGLVIDIIAGDFTPATQLGQIQDAISSGKYDGIVAETADGNTACKPLRAAAKKLPIAVVTSPICGSNPYTPGTVKFSGRIDFQDGQTTAQLACQALGGAPAEIAFVTGIVALSSVQLFNKGFVAGIKKGCPNAKIVASPAGNYDPAASLAAAQDVLQAHPNISLIATGADNMTVAVAKGLKSAGKLGQVKLVGYGGTKEAFALIKKGDMYGTVMLLPSQESSIGVHAVADALEGKPIAQKIYLEKDDPIFKGKGNIITKANVAQYTAQW